MAENAASVPRPARPAERGGLAARIASALVLAPILIAAIWYGEVWLVVLVALAAAIMACEWARLVGSLQTQGDLIYFAATAGGIVLAAALVAIWAGLAVAAVCLILRLALAPGRDRLPRWTIGGLLWIVLPSLGLIWLRGTPGGLMTTLWVVALVWSVDIAAYAVGKTIGGAKLAPYISANKTWSGLIGGVIGAVLVGAAAGWIAAPPGKWLPLALLSGGLAIVEQMGDIAESYAKRRFGAKDSSTLIPGHGGLLDRLDGMLAVVTAVVLISLARGGSVMTWQ